MVPCHTGDMGDRGNRGCCRTLGIRILHKRNRCWRRENICAKMNRSQWGGNWNMRKLPEKKGKYLQKYSGKKEREEQHTTRGWGGRKKERKWPLDKGGLSLS